MDSSNHDDVVEQLFEKLESHIRNGQTRKASKTIDEILKLIPNDPDAVRCKVNLLIEQGNTDAALRLIDSSGSIRCQSTSNDSSLSSLGEVLSLERAYCLYRQGRLDEASQALDSIDPARTVARLLLEGQLHYRMGNYAAAIRAYDALYSMADGGDAEAKAVVGRAEVQANVVAAYVSEGRMSGDEISRMISQKLHTTPRAGFELAFNIACGLLGENNLMGKVSSAPTGKVLAEAREALALARRVGEEALYEEDFGDEDDISAELFPVDVQLAYVMALEQRWDEALVMLQSLSSLTADTLSQAVVAINLVSLLLRTRPGDRRAANEGLKALEPFVERRGGYLSASSSISLRLGVQHVEQLLVAYCAAAITAGKMEIAREALRSLQREKHFLNQSKAALLMHAALLTKENKSKDALALLEKSEADAQVPSLFMRAQIQATRPARGGEPAGPAGSLGSTLDALHSLPPSIRNRGGVVATQIALLDLQGDVDGALQLIQQSIQQSSDDGSNGTNMSAQLWLRRKAADLEVGRGNLEAAMGFLAPLLTTTAAAASVNNEDFEGADDAVTQDEKLLILFPWIMATAEEGNGVGTKERLLSVLSDRFALSDLDLHRANDATDPRPSPEELDALETSLPATFSHTKATQAHDQAQGTTQVKLVGNGRGSGGDQAQERKKKNRKRKKRYPQGYDPANPPPPPDPERWLPKWQRSDAKKAKKKRKDKEKEMLKGSQGAGKVDASLDRTGPGASTAVPSGGGGPSSSAPSKVKSSKKKGKSRR